MTTRPRRPCAGRIAGERNGASGSMIVVVKATTSEGDDSDNDESTDYGIRNAKRSQTYLFNTRKQAGGITPADRIASHVVVQVRQPTPEPQGILCGPPSGNGVVIPRPEPFQ